jgi:hypothetical protein
MDKTIEQLENRAKQLRVEIIMAPYYDGWTLNGMKHELSSIEGQIKIKKTQERC